MACLDRSGAGLEAVLAEIAAAGGRAIAIPADVTDPESLVEAVHAPRPSSARWGWP